MSTDAIDHLDIDIPSSIRPHARVVLAQWVEWARAAAAKGDGVEAARLLQLIQDKLDAELAWYEREVSRCEG